MEHECVRYLEGGGEHQEPNLDHDSDDHLGDVVVIQEHHLATNLDGPLENGAESKQEVELETSELSVCIFSKGTFSGA